MYHLQLLLLSHTCATHLSVEFILLYGHKVFILYSSYSDRSSCCTQVYINEHIRIPYCFYSTNMQIE